MEGREKELGLRLRDCRKRTGMKQEDVGRAIGMGKSMISDWERGKRVPSLSMTIKLARLYNVPVGELVDVQDVQDDAPFGEKLSHYLAFAPGGIEGLAQCLGRSVDDVNRMCAGDLDPAEGEIGRMAEYLGIMPEQLDSTDAARQDLFSDPDRRTLLNLARYGSAQEVRQVSALIDALRATNPEFYDGDDPA